MTTSTSTSNPAPGIPTAKAFKLTYRQYRMTHTINFEFLGDFEAARKKSEEYCNLMRIQFVNVEPLFMDLDILMAIKKKNEESSQNSLGRAV